MKSKNRFITVALALNIALGLSTCASLNAATFVVNSTLDTAGSTCSAPCTLRQAITAANLTTAADSINFGFRVSGEILLQPSTALPTITQPVTINGYSQNGSSVNTDPIASNAVLRIRVDGLNAGSTASGFSICANTVTIKGLSITRFSQRAIAFGSDGGNACATAPSNGIASGNFIGLTSNGSTAAGNNRGVFADSVQVTIGSTNVADRNIISSSTNTGLLFTKPGSNGSIVIGNLIGTDKSASLDRGNGSAGIEINSASTTLGSATAPNLVAFNGSGIVITDGLNNRLNFNRFVANDGLGIDLIAPGNVSGVSLNDNGDGDAGGNGQQNYLDDGFAVARTPTGINIQGTLRRIASSNVTFTIAAYASTTCDSSLHGEGEQFLGTATEATSTGVAPINVDIPLATQPPIGSFITTTVTSPGGSTSEFSTCVRLEVPLLVNSLNDVVDGNGCNATHCSLREAILASNQAPAPDLIHFGIATPASGELLIQPLSPLPIITQPAFIDGYSQSGTSVNTDPLVSNAVLRVRVDGSLISAGTSLISVCSNDSTIRGLSVTGMTSGSGRGIDVCGSVTSGVVIAGNFIGLTSGGVTSAPSDTGIFINGQVNVGGSAAADKNVIGNSGISQAILLQNNSGTKILGNLIGTDKSGSLDRCAVGVHITGTVTSALIGNANAPNVIRFCTSGIRTNPGTTIANNQWVYNQIADSNVLAIDLLSDRVTLNDLNDVDTGPNGLQNFPVINRAERTAAGIQISGTLDVPSALSATDYTIGVYANSACDASGHGEGERLLGAVVVQLNGSSENFSFSLNTDDALEAGVQITSTATGPEGSSEFSACVPASDALPGIAVDSALDIGLTALGCEVSGDGNECTLREAITLANSNVDASLIRFDIPGNAPLTIAVATLLPAITAPLSIDGYTQAGASENAASVGTDANLGVQIREAGAANVTFGLMICASDVSIRGLSITQFASAGIATQMNASANCSVQGSNVRISGNFIGLLANGVPFPNGNGVLAANTQVLIGGPALADRNLISSNNLQGVHIAGAASSGSVVQNNLIGTGLLPGTNRGNGGTGIVINDASDVIVGGSGILANTMSFNASGIVVTGTGTRNQLAANDYAANTGPGIDLAGFGITPNDINDVDSGPNNLQNFPVLTDASASASSISFNGTLDVPAATNNAPYLITLYESDSCDSSGNGEGSLRLAATSVNFSAAAENFSITLKVPPNNASSVITATATDALGNTSEFSSCIAGPQLEAIFADGFE